MYVSAEIWVLSCVQREHLTTSVLHKQGALRLFLIWCEICCRFVCEMRHQDASDISVHKDDIVEGCLSGLMSGGLYILCTVCYYVLCASKRRQEMLLQDLFEGV